MMFLRADSRACGLIVDHTPAYIAGRYAAMRDFWLAQAREQFGSERTSAARAARRFHHSYMAELATLQGSI